MKSKKQKYLFFGVNVNPQKRNINDCQIRAFVTLLGISYKEVQSIFKTFSKALGQAQIFRTEVVESVASEFLKLTIPKVKSKITFGDFCNKQLNKKSSGDFLLVGYKHVAVCSKGVLVDSWDSGKVRLHRVYKL